jgi:hypothetical protein
MEQSLPVCLSQAASEASLEYLNSRLPQFTDLWQKRNSGPDAVLRVLSIQPDSSAVGFDGEAALLLFGLGLSRNLAYDLVGPSEAMTRLMEGFGKQGSLMDSFTHIGTINEFLSASPSPADCLYDIIILPLWRLSQEHHTSPQSLQHLVKACYDRLRPDCFSSLLLIEPETAQGMYAVRGVLCEHLSSEGLSKIGANPPLPAHAGGSKGGAAKKTTSDSAGGFSTRHGFNASIDVRALHRSLVKEPMAASAAAAASSKAMVISPTAEDSSATTAAVASAAPPLFDIDVFCEPLEAAVDLTSAVKAYRIAEAEIRSRSSGKSGGVVAGAMAMLTEPGSIAAASCTTLSEVFGCDAAKLLVSYPDIALECCDELLALSLYNVRMGKGEGSGGKDGEDSDSPSSSSFPKIIGHVPMRAFHVIKFDRRNVALSPRKILKERGGEEAGGLAAHDDEEEMASPQHKRAKTGGAGGAAASADGSGHGSAKNGSGGGGGGLLSSLSTVAFSALEVVSSVTGLGGSNSSTTCSSVSIESTRFSATASASDAAGGAGGRKKWWLTDLSALSSSASASDSDDDENGSSSNRKASAGHGEYGRKPPRETAEYSSFWDRMPNGLHSKEHFYFASRRYRRFPLAIPPLPLLYSVPGHIEYEADGTHRLLRHHLRPGMDGSGSGSGSAFTKPKKSPLAAAGAGAGAGAEETTVVRNEDEEGTATTTTTKMKSVSVVTTTTSGSATGASKWKELDEPPPLVKDDGSTAVEPGTDVRFDPWFPQGEGRGFLNAGLARWNAQRAKWQARPAGFTHPPYPADCLDELDDMLYDLTDTSVREMNLPGPVRLPDMLDLLWESWSPVSEDSDTDPDW